MKLGHCRGQVHRRQDPLGDVLVLDERDETQRGVELGADELELEGPVEKLGPRSMFDNLG